MVKAAPKNSTATSWWADTRRNNLLNWRQQRANDRGVAAESERNTLRSYAKKKYTPYANGKISCGDQSARQKTHSRAIERNENVAMSTNRNTVAVQLARESEKFTGTCENDRASHVSIIFTHLSASCVSSLFSSLLLSCRLIREFSSSTMSTSSDHVETRSTMWQKIQIANDIWSFFFYVSFSLLIDSAKYWFLSSCSYFFFRRCQVRRSTKVDSIRFWHSPPYKVNWEVTNFVLFDVILILIARFFFTSPTRESRVSDFFSSLSSLERYHH